MNKVIQTDIYRLYGNSLKRSLVKAYIHNRAFRQQYYYRRYNYSNNLAMKIFYRLMWRKYAKYTNIDLPMSAKIGEGFLMLHPACITINSKSVIGKNCTILKGATIGAIKDEKGLNKTPIIGDNVYIGLNSTIVGGIRIGNNVLIAANSFVNKDIPEGSLVIGNPATIHKRKNASERYITNPV